MFVFVGEGAGGGRGAAESVDVIERQSVGFLFPFFSHAIPPTAQK